MNHGRTIQGRQKRTRRGRALARRIEGDSDVLLDAWPHVSPWEKMAILTAMLMQDGAWNEFSQAIANYQELFAEPFTVERLNKHFTIADREPEQRLP
jgi:hypothetical protein